MSHNY